MVASAALVSGVSSAPALAAPLAQSPAALPASPEIPSEQDIANAKKNQDATSTQITKIESLLDTATQSLQASMMNSMRTNNDYSAALVNLKDRQTAADAAKAKAAAAAKISAKAKTQVGQLASTMYKTGGLNPSVQSLITSGGGSASDVIYQASTLSILGTNRSQTFNNAQSAAATASSLEDAAKQAKQAADDAAKVAASAKTAADSAVSAQNALVTKNQQQRGVLIGQLATLKNTTVALESARITGLEQQKEAARLAAIIAASKNQPAPTPPSNPGTSNPGTSDPGSNNPAPVDPPAPPVVQPPVVTPPVVTPPVVTPPVVVPPKPKPPVVVPPVVNPPSGTNISGMVAFAMSKVGGPYVWGGTGPVGYDCSGLIWAAFRSVGVNLPRGGSDQFWQAPTRVPLSQMQYGDILAFNDNGSGFFSHVAIYIGNGQVVQALNPNDGIAVTPLSWMSTMALYGYAARY
ncbi:cell wall endopeptidase [Psychromicrobium lacuslunae]|uniref:Cell wall endopeptidase n=1 Tax=Psychromicrobium lacuslunae TaxID=1618207 RepID=A0A0D4C474_9MICC|nr:cell wall endopeptidase [Psychromicrobium lacuslunae]